MLTNGTPEELIEAARNGRDGALGALGALLELYRNYLHLLARTQIGERLGSRIDASDVVQETFLEAHRDFPGFQGTCERELIAWLRRILVRNLADQLKHNFAHGRDIRRQQSLEVMLERSSTSVHEALSTGLSSPSEQASRREKAVLLADALAKLSSDYQTVITLRNLQHLKFDEVAKRMGRSATACRLLWMRALQKLRAAVGGEIEL